MSLIDKRRPADTVERDIVVGMIVSDRFLARFRPHWDPAWHQSDLCRMVAGWCVEHWDRYQRAPRQEIQKRFDDWSGGKNVDEADIEDLEQMLVLASQEYERQEQFNDDYLIDRAERWARKQVLKSLVGELDGALDHNDVDEAAARFQGVQLPQIGGRRTWTDPTDREAIRRAFERTYEPLYSIPGPLGKLIGPQLYREGFVAWMAPEKRGKTALLLELAYWATRGRCNVAFFAIGDMSDDQLLVRWASRLTGLPEDPEFAGRRRVPVGIEFDGSEPEILYEEKKLPRLDWKTAYKACRKFEQKWGKGRIRFQSWPNFVCSVRDLERELDAWESEGWTADVIVVDYADNLVQGERDDYRHRVNNVWRALRTISQERRALLITATQTDADSYEKGQIRLHNYSEDKRKYAHVTAIGAINQDAEERRLGILRLQWLLLRRGRPGPQVCLLSDLSRGRVLVNPGASWWFKADEEDNNNDQ